MAAQQDGTHERHRTHTPGKPHRIACLFREFAREYARPAGAVTGGPPQSGLAPQKRWDLAKDVGKAVAALLDENPAYPTGTVIEVRDGMDLRKL